MKNSDRVSVNSFYSHIYMIMGFGLLISSLVSFIMINYFGNTMMNILQNNYWVLPVTWVIELITVYVLGKFTSNNSSTALPGFVFYSALNGFTLSFSLIYYDPNSITIAFIIAAIMFFGLAIYGTVTKRSLTGAGKAARAGLLGVIVASIIYTFTGGSTFDFIISIASVIIFSILIAYDNQRIKNVYDRSYGDVTRGEEINLALSVYLDFINIFTNILRITSRDSNNNSN